jgi:nucleoid DNA-binding protein
MVGKVIRDYMEGGARKLIVPGFGSFIRRDGGEIVFSGLLRSEDFTLSEMVEDRGGYSEVEAMALIDRFIFETRDAIERTGSATIEGFGTLTLDPRGAYQFQYSPTYHPPTRQEHAVQESLFETIPPKKEQPAAEPLRVRPAVDAPKSVVPARQNPEPAVRRPQPAKPRHKEPQKQKHSRADIILIVALVAAGLALVAMAFAFSAGNMPFISK